MIKAESKNGTVSISIDGKLDELVSDTMVIVRGVWEAIKANDKEEGRGSEHADDFRRFIENNAGLFFETHDELVVTCLDKIIDKLKKLVDECDED